MQDDSANVNRDPQSRPWSAADILLGLYLVWLRWPILCWSLVKGLRVEQWYYGEGTNELDNRLGLWVSTLAFPFRVLTFPLLFAAFSHTRLDQLGLTTRRF